MPRIMYPAFCALFCFAMSINASSANDKAIEYQHCRKSDNSGKSVKITINQVRNRSTYMLGLMKLALSYNIDRSYIFEETRERLSKNAQREAALDNTINVFWGGTSVEQEKDFIPVRVDGYRGLMSLRFLLIRGDDQSKFSSVSNLADLRQFSMGQGHGWSDGRILEAAGLTVERSPKKSSLYYMLDGGRFDAFPRGATEAWRELEAYKHLNLKVEEKLIIKYPLPTYFFVHKGNRKLAQDIEYGLSCALDDGSFDTFFYSNERVKKFLAVANLEQRTIITLENPFLPKESAPKSGEYNLSIEQLIEGAKRLKNDALVSANTPTP